MMNKIKEYFLARLSERSTKTAIIGVGAAAVSHALSPEMTAAVSSLALVLIGVTPDGGTK